MTLLLSSRTAGQHGARAPMALSLGDHHPGFCALNSEEGRTLSTLLGCPEGSEGLGAPLSEAPSIHVSEPFARYGQPVDSEPDQAQTSHQLHRRDTHGPEAAQAPLPLLGLLGDSRPSSLYRAAAPPCQTALPGASHPLRLVQPGGQPRAAGTLPGSSSGTEEAGGLTGACQAPHQARPYAAAALNGPCDTHGG